MSLSRAALLTMSAGVFLCGSVTCREMVRNTFHVYVTGVALWRGFNVGGSQPNAWPGGAGCLWSRRYHQANIKSGCPRQEGKGARIHDILYGHQILESQWPRHLVKIGTHMSLAVATMSLFFPTCQVRVVRFYVSCLLLLFFSRIMLLCNFETLPPPQSPPQSPAPQSKPKACLYIYRHMSLRNPSLTPAPTINPSPPEFKPTGCL